MGQAMAEEFAAQGAHIVVTYRADEDDNDDAAAEIERWASMSGP